MSYAFQNRRAFGTIDEWEFPSLHFFDPNEVFVLRLTTTGFPLQSPKDALQFIRAAGRDQNLSLDVRGVGFWQTPLQTSPSTWTLDLIYTTPTRITPVPILTDNGASIAAKIQNDAGVQGAFPGFAVTGQVFGNLTAPPDAIDHWRSQPILWDHLLGTGGQGGPTDTFASPAEFSIVKGQAEDGKRATPWQIGKPPLNGGNTPSTTVWWAAGLLAAAALGFHYVTKGKKR